MYNKKFAERLYKLRTQKNVSAREMSLDIGQNDSYINRIENAKALPSMQAFFYICEYLKISPRDFFNIDEQHPAKINEILEELYKLNEEQLDIILIVSKGLLKK